MTYPFDTTTSAVTQNFLAPSATAARRLPEPVRLASAAKPAQRTARLSFLDNDGRHIETTHTFPDMAGLVAACASFARGTLIATEAGPVAVEDLAPGTRIMTRDNGAVALRWIASTAVNYRTTGARAETGSLRLLAGAMGDRRPSDDLVLHHSARVLIEHRRCAIHHGTESVLVPATVLLNSDSVFELRPIGAVEFFNLAFDRHQIIFANGLETESYHPGPQGCTSGVGEFPHHLARLFPYLGGRLAAFGPMARPRLQEDEAIAMTRF